MIEFFRAQFDYAWEKPVERLLKPGIKATVLIGLLTGAAQWTRERSRSMDRQSLAKLSKAAYADPVKTGSLKK
jgi:hypothetical protein